MRLLAPALALSFALSAVPAAHAEPTGYPMLFSCNRDGQMNDLLTPPELEDALRQLVGKGASHATIATRIRSLCNGARECEEQLAEMIDLSPGGTLANARQAALRTVEQEIARLRDKYAEGPIPASQGPGALVRARSALLELQACRQGMESLPPESLVHGDRVTTYYPYDSNYIYATGCATTGFKGCADAAMASGDIMGIFAASSRCDQPRKSVIEQGVSQALAMGADPYVALALGMMEGGANGIAGLYLDPIARFKVLADSDPKYKDLMPKFLRVGMPSDKVVQNVHSHGHGVLNSYTTIWETKPGLIENADLSGRLQRFVQLAQFKVKPGTSYFCRDLTSSAASILDHPAPDRLCLQLGFKPEFSTPLGVAEAIEHGLVFEHVRQIENTQVPGKKDPAFRLQRFNGFTNLMGSAEGVPAFRAGVNYNTHPAYGYQAMDFVVNSLMTNPEIRQIVDHARTQLKAIGAADTSRSILCRDRKLPGTYVMNTGDYFEKHRNSPRMEIVKQHFDEGKTWNQLSERERRVMKIEFQQPSVSKALGLKIDVWGDLKKGKYEKAYQRYFSEVYPSRDTVGKASDFPWRRLSPHQVDSLSQKLACSKF